MINETTIGSKISAIRESKQITQEALAERSGLSLEQIKTIEEANLVGSLFVLLKIARALGVRLGTFLDDNVTDAPTIVRKQEASPTISFSTQQASNHPHLQFYSLARGKADRHLEPFLIDVLPAEEQTLIASSHEGEEFIYVLSGKITVHYAQATYFLQTGDSIYYDSIVSHLVFSSIKEPAKVLAVLYTPC
jgi:transcriptional regulator with XRE-family HTH domain